MRQRIAGLALIMGVALAVAGCSGSSAGSPSGDPSADVEKITLRYASPLTGGSLSDSAQWWIDEVEKRTDGQVEIEEFFSGSLVPAGETLAAVQDGRADLGYMTHAYSPADFPLWEVGGIPFGPDNGVAAAAAFTQLYDDGSALKDEFDANGIVPLYFGPVDVGATFTTKPLATVEDLKGLNVRASGGNAAALAAVGARPVAIDPAEMYESLERGVIDSVVVTFESGPSYGFDEVVSDTVDIGIGLYASSAHVINAEVWAELPDNVKQVMTEVSQEMNETKGAEFLTAEGEATCAALTGADVNVSIADDIIDSNFRDDSRKVAVDHWLTNAAASGMSEDDLVAFEEEFDAAYEDAAGNSDFEPAIIACAAG